MAAAQPRLRSSQRRDAYSEFSSQNNSQSVERKRAKSTHLRSQQVKFEVDQQLRSDARHLRLRKQDEQMRKEEERQNQLKKTDKALE